MFCTKPLAGAENLWEISEGNTVASFWKEVVFEASNRAAGQLARLSLYGV